MEVSTINKSYMIAPVCLPVATCHIFVDVISIHVLFPNPPLQYNMA